MAVERKQGKRESPEEIAKQKTKKKAEKADDKVTTKKATSKKASSKKATTKKAADKPAAKKETSKKATTKKPSTKKTTSKAAASDKPKRRSPARRRGAAEAPATTTSTSSATRPVVRARAKYVRSSARKARLVIDHIRGKSVDEAKAVLRHSPRGVAEDIGKLLDSAIANAENNHELVSDDLLVKEVTADEGPTLRRFRPRAQGRATRIRKRTSHLSIALTTKD